MRTCSGMLPGYVAGHYDYDEAHIDLGALAGSPMRGSIIPPSPAGPQRKTGPVRQPSAGAVRTALDQCRINAQCVAGAGRDRQRRAGQTDQYFLDRWEALSARAMSQEGPMRIAVVGAGAGGVGYCLRSNKLGKLQAAAGKPPDNIEFHLFSNTSILPTHNAKVRAAFLKTLQHRNVVLHREPVTQVEPGILKTDVGDAIAAEILWVTAAGAPDWPARRV